MSHSHRFSLLSRYLGVLLCALYILCSAAATNAASRPNIVLIIADDHAWTDYGFMGSTHVRTPRLDRLAARSRLFPRGYVPSSVCCPSLASIITGKYPHQHKVVCNDPPAPADLSRREFYASDSFARGRARLTSYIEDTPTLPRVLGSAGYASFQAGKWWQNSFRHGGFTHGMTHGEESAGGRHGDRGLEIGRQSMKPIYDFVVQATSNQQPFLVWYAPLLPHDPHNPPARLLAKYANSAPSIHVARYWAMIEWFDETCGQLFDFLRARGLEENTVIAFLADNGWIQSLDSPRYAPKSKQSQYDGGLRTPILLSWPGRVPAQRVNTAVSSIDLMPTLLNLAGVLPPPELPGIDLLNDKLIRERPAVFGACFTHDCVDLNDPASGLRWRWIVAGDWKLIVPNPTHEAGPTELYQITADPFETENLFTVETSRARALQKQLGNWWSPQSLLAP
jgi:arylsulfatase A-like enzyme